MGNLTQCCPSSGYIDTSDNRHLSFEQIQKKFSEHGQNHVLKHWDRLDENQQKNLLDDLNKIDVEQINGLFATTKSTKQTGEMSVVEPELVRDKAQLSDDDIQRFTQSGLETIKQGKAAVVLLAGGQGTRLGFGGPKGMYQIGLNSDKSIFQVLVERFLRAQMLAHDAKEVTGEIQKCKMLIMTSQANHIETVKFFIDNNFFGAEESSFEFFPQDMLPQLNPAGKMLMESIDHIKMGPNGNGGFFAAVDKNPRVKLVLQQTDYVQIIGVDNIINKILDPVFIGYTKENNLHAAGKAVIKRDADEKVGVFCRREINQQLVYDIAEYSEISKQDVTAINANGSLKYNLGYILVLMISSSELLKLTRADSLNSMYHVAKKKADTYNPILGKEQKQKDSFKFELFLHSFLQFIEAGKFGVLMVDRSTEFAPIKNANSAKQDCPDTARELIYNEAQQWLENAGFTIKDSAVGNIEISPLLSYSGENLDCIKKSRHDAFILPTYIDKDGNIKEIVGKL